MAKPAFKQNRKRPVKTSKVAEHGKTASSAETSSRPAEAQRAPRVARAGARLPETIGLVEESAASEDYALIDTGHGEKLERYGKLLIRRPEGQAIWAPSLGKEEWAKADAHFSGDTDEEGRGRWRYPKLSGHEQLPETWPLAFDGLNYLGRFTSFRHTGVFPEQAAHWQGLQRAITRAAPDQSVRVLNLFGYTGLASLVAARAGAHVTHVDASKKAIGWARENQSVARLDDKPIRWICEDAARFCAREVRRRNTYDIILLDPPAFGRGPKGEVWQLFEDLPYLLDDVRALQSKQPIMTVLTAYAIRASHLAIHEAMQEAFAGMSGRLESGELILRQQVDGRALSTSMFSRFVGEAVAWDSEP
ncbi:MAG: class I SAM-dependent methyltransferase [Ahrensia sp.]|nr:class I SAM-dependent methyltransferase [Ahrensia sp.]